MSSKKPILKHILPQKSRQFKKSKLLKDKLLELIIDIDNPNLNFKVVAKRKQLQDKIYKACIRMANLQSR